MRVCAADHPDAESARSRYRTLAASNTAALVELRPETGRMHQLRVDMVQRSASSDRRRLFPLRRGARPGTARRSSGRCCTRPRSPSRTRPAGGCASKPRRPMTSSTWQPRFAPALRRPERRMARRGSDSRSRARRGWRPPRSLAQAAVAAAEPRADPQARPLWPDPRRRRTCEGRHAADRRRTGACAAAARDAGERRSGRVGARRGGCSPARWCSTRTTRCWP